MDEGEGLLTAARTTRRNEEEPLLLLLLPLLLLLLPLQLAPAALEARQAAVAMAWRRTREVGRKKAEEREKEERVGALCFFFFLRWIFRTSVE